MELNLNNLVNYNLWLTVWKKNVQHGGAHIIEVECAYIPHA
jgi:hypothetical protein